MTLEIFPLRYQPLHLTNFFIAKVLISVYIKGDPIVLFFFEHFRNVIPTI